MKIQVLERCFTLLDLLRDGSQTLSELSVATGVQTTTLRNILRTLEELRVVGRDGKKYKLGPKLHDFMLPLQTLSPLQSLAMAAVREIADQTQEQVLSIALCRDTSQQLRLEIVADSRDLQSAQGQSEGPEQINVLDPTHDMSARLLLANVSEGRFEQWLEGRGEAGSEDLRALIEPLRGQKTAIQHEHTREIVQLIRLAGGADSDRTIVLCVIVPAGRFDAERHSQIENSLGMAADKLEKTLTVNNTVDHNAAESAASASITVASESVRKRREAVKTASKVVEATAVGLPTKTEEREAAPEAPAPITQPVKEPVRRSWAGFRG